MRSKEGNTPSKPRMVTNLANKSHPWENSENSLVFLEAASLMRLHMNKQKSFAVWFPPLKIDISSYLYQFLYKSPCECMFVEWLTRATSNLKEPGLSQVGRSYSSFLFFFFCVIWATFIICFLSVLKGTMSQRFHSFFWSDKIIFSLTETSK